MDDRTEVKLTLRLDPALARGLETLAERASMDVAAYAERVLTRRVLDSDAITDPSVRQRLELRDKVADTLIGIALQMERDGAFNEHITLDVFREMMSSREARGEYEALVGGGATDTGLPGKVVNLYLGRCIKRALKAESQKDEAGRIRRAFVKGEPIQSYTLLRRPDD